MLAWRAQQTYPATHCAICARAARPAINITENPHISAATKRRYDAGITEYSVMNCCVKSEGEKENAVGGLSGLQSGDDSINAKYSKRILDSN